MSATRFPGEYASAEVVQVIRVLYPRGKGTVDDCFRRVTAYFAFDGTLLSEHDPAVPQGADVA